MDLHALVRDFAVYLAAAPSKYLILRVHQHETRVGRPLSIHPWYIRGLFSLVSRIRTMVDSESDDRINAQSENRLIPRAAGNDVRIIELLPSDQGSRYRTNPTSQYNCQELRAGPQAGWPDS